MTPFDAGQDHPADPTAPTNGALPIRAVAVYRQEQVNNLSQQELLLMLYDGAIRFCGEARTAIECGDFNKSYHWLTRARAIVTELLAILDPDIQTEATINLRRLYDFCIYGITEVNFTKDLGLLAGVVRTLETLKSAWAEIDFAGAVRELTQAAGLPNPAGAVLSPVGPGAAGARPASEDSDAQTAAASSGLSILG